MPRVERQQFLVGRHEVIHMPTGARFMALPGAMSFHKVDWGTSLKAANDNGYRREDVLAMAGKLHLQRLIWPG